ncbi:primosomal protein N' [Candidatus Saccharibacteria bacterium]|nr:primosomal protein N' [Candidatus Saccharibacteria bacterium]
MFYEVIPTKIFRSGATTLTYTSDLSLTPGNIVKIPLGHSFSNGIVLKKVKQPPFKCKNIEKLLYKTPLPNHLLKAALWLSAYYLSPLPSTASLLLPVGVEKHRRFASGETVSSRRQRGGYGRALAAEPRNDGSEDGGRRTSCRPQASTIQLNSYQYQALKDLKSIKSSTRLLFGVTGSGKTNIYLKLASEALENDQSVILLVPEIALTSQLVQIFESTFSRQVTLIHSKQTESERHLIWEDLLLSKTPQIVIGPRSALFAPLKNLGLILIDEAHESTYYQENTPKYSALRLASFLATTLKIPCILGSATPLVSDFYLAKSKNAVVSLTEKAKETAIKPEIKVIDSTSRDSFSKNRYFSDALLETIKANLKNGHQTLIYHNRRGSAPVTLCENCGWQALCPNCLLPLTLHSDSFSLLCHTCGHEEKIPPSCPDCHHPSILHKGFGTKLLESELKKLFPEVRIARFDADNKKGESLDALYDEVKSGEIKIIIGTQTVSRGLDLPHLASIGIVQADSGLSLPDFSSEEKTFELLTQVIGRVGRGHLNTASVIIQTYKPSSPVINFAKNADYLGFYNFEVKERKKTAFPPFSYLAKLTVTYKTEQTTLKKVRTLSKNLNKKLVQLGFTSIKISSPTPCFHERTSSGYSWQLILKSKNRKDLTTLLKNFQDDCKISLDPLSLL